MNTTRLGGLLSTFTLAVLLAQAVAADPAAPDTAAALASVSSPSPNTGLGPAASKVYGAGGVSIGGYGEMLYENFDRLREDDLPSELVDRVDFLRAVIYAGYEFDERLLFNSEIELEHGGVKDEAEVLVNTATGEGAAELSGEVKLEFAYLDWRLSPRFGVRAGMLLVPVGLLNETHEPTTFIGARRPDVERFIIPTTWSAEGAGPHGEVAGLRWRAYLLEGLDGRGFDAATGIRDGCQDGMSAMANRPAFAGRLDWTGTPGLSAGVSGYSGGAWQTPKPTGVELDPVVGMFDVHGRLEWRGLEAQALYVATTLSDAGALSDALGLTGAERLGERSFGFEVAAQYDVLSAFVPGTTYRLSPYARFERYDTQESVPGGVEDPANERAVWVVGAAFQPHTNVILKADREQRSTEADTGVSQWNVALGYVF